jgi:Flp pilus assembly pilin Flp
MDEIITVPGNRTFLSDEDGTTAVEYAVMLALIFGAVITAVMAFGSNTGGLFGSTDSNLRSHGFGS